MKRDISRNAIIRNAISKNGGFTYIEMLMAMAVLVIIAIPVIPALNQAHANHHYAVSRRVAQGHAVNMALEARKNPENAEALVQSAADDDARFAYRLRLVIVGGSTREYTAGDASVVSEMPAVGGASFSTGFNDLFAGGMVIVAEVFDANGNLAGQSVSKTN